MSEDALLVYTLRLADTALINGHRLSEWCGHAPVLEEELALANLALDLIGQARSLYAYAGVIEGEGRGEDAFAYLRDVMQYRNLLIVERPNGDFATTILRQFLLSAFMHPFWEAMTGSTDATLSAIAAKAVKEAAYHLRHCREWTVRLGDGTAESHRRMEEALAEEWPYTGELFESDKVEHVLIASGIAVDPATLKGKFDANVDPVLGEARLARPHQGWMQTGGRHGRHSEHLGHVLAELQYLQRTYPGATW
ncbi:MAG: phenylacetate-CoA oxygenase subunit PaaC [Hyphomicrobiales bacterium]|nr:phenylacetate-CoA oxygenase subunit PaaC [Hyphomicrobiales bacterium]